MKKLDDIDFIAFVGKLEDQYLIHLSDAKDEILDRFSGDDNVYGDELPWQKTDRLIRLRPKEVTLWAGINGHGKSMVLSHVVAHLIKFTSCLIASLEMPISATGQRMIRQIVGLDKPSKEYVESALNFTDRNLWVYDQLDTVPTERILGMVIYAISELGIKHVVIDSLMKCGIDDDDYNGQKAFVDRLCWAAKTYGGHIHLVHHIRKTRSEEELPDKFDVMGSSALTNLVDNVVIVHRNKKKENQKEEERIEDDPDTRLIVAKQRHGEWEGRIGLWFHKSSQQYLGRPTHKPEYFNLKEEMVA